MATFNTWAYFQGDGWVQFLPGMPEHAFDEAAIVLHNVHYATTCAGRFCVIHNPVRHHMEKWPLVWRNDRGIFERICEHGVGHPDPSQFDYWRKSGRLTVQGIHGCCINEKTGRGCCAPTIS